MSSQLTNVDKKFSSFSLFKNLLVIGVFLHGRTAKLQCGDKRSTLRGEAKGDRLRPLTRVPGSEGLRKKEAKGIGRSRPTPFVNSLGRLPGFTSRFLRGHVHQRPQFIGTVKNVSEISPFLVVSCRQCPQFISTAKMFQK